MRQALMPRPRRGELGRGGGRVAARNRVQLSGRGACAEALPGSVTARSSTRRLTHSCPAGSPQRVKTLTL